MVTMQSNVSYCELPGFVTQVNALEVVAVTSNAATATAVAPSIATSSLAANVTLWVSGKAYTIGSFVISPASANVYYRIISGAGTTDPSVDTTNWRIYSTTVSVKDYGAIGDGTTNDTPAIQAALNANKYVYIPNGTYLIDGEYTTTAGLNMQTGQHIIGQSAKAIFLQGGVRYMLSAGSYNDGSSNPLYNRRNIKISNLTLRNNTGTFLEQKHLMMVSGVSDVVIEKVNFIGFQGDGICIASGTIGGIERHNENIKIKDCIFDGVNKQNRNPISIIDGNGVLINNCLFKNCSKDNMPGPIDFEPDFRHTTAIGKNITVQNCIFENCGGLSAFIYMTYPAGVLTVKPQSIQFNNNYINSTCSFRSCFIRFKTAEKIDETTHVMGIEIIGNHFGGSAYASMYIEGVRGAKINNNTFTDKAGIVNIGGQTTSGTLLFANDIDFCNNIMQKSGSSDGALGLGNVNRINILSNSFIQPRSTRAIIFNALTGETTSSSYVTIQGNRFVKNTTLPQTHLVYVSGLHTFRDYNTNSWQDNVADATLTNQFLPTTYMKSQKGSNSRNVPEKSGTTLP